MRILLVLADDRRHRDGRRWAEKPLKLSYAPLTLSLLAGLVPDELNADVRTIDDGFDILPDDFDADLVGISATTPNAIRAYEIADKARARGIAVVLGGYHPTLLPDEASEHADAVVVGFAESTWPELLRDFKEGKLKKFYRQESMEGFTSNLPSPRRDLLNPKAYVTPHTLEATRGCPNPCNFCVVTTVCKRKGWTRPIERVVADIKAMKAKRITFLDSSPTEYSEYNMQLHEALKPLRVKWSSNATMKVANNEDWIKSAADAGCQGVLIGFESVNQTSLVQHKKRFNSVKEYKSAIKKLHKYKIPVLGAFVFGLDDDGPEVFSDTEKFVEDARVDLVQYSIFTPFPGTPAFERLDREGRILTRDWRLYDGKHVVYRPQKMTAEELQAGFYRAWERTYRLRSIWRRVWGIRTIHFVLKVIFVNLVFRYLGKSFTPKTSAKLLKKQRRDNLNRKENFVSSQ